MFTLDEIWTNSESFKNCEIYTSIISCFLLWWSIYINMINIIGKLTSRPCYIPAYFCEEALILASTLYQDQSKWPSSRYFLTLRKNSYFSFFTIDRQFCFNIALANHPIHPFSKKLLWHHLKCRSYFRHMYIWPWAGHM